MRYFKTVMLVRYQKLFVMMVLICVLTLTLWTNIGRALTSIFSSRNELPTVHEVAQKLHIDAFTKTEVVKVCKENFVDKRAHLSGFSDLPIIYYVTPTYPRPEQAPELTRLSHTLMHVPRVHWIVADDDRTCSDLVLDILNNSGLPFTHLSSPRPTFYLHSPSRGVSNRRAAISWIQKNVKEGVLYFGDDDNTVDLQLFKEIRHTKKVSMFPVGLIKTFGISAPVFENGKLQGFFDSWPDHRTFPVDMAGFAVNVAFLKPGATMAYREGYEEDTFLRSLNVTAADIEPAAANCTKVLVWHTQSVENKKPTLKIDIDKLTPMYHNFVSLIKEVTRMNMASLNPDAGLKTFFTHRKP